MSPQLTYSDHKGFEGKLGRSAQDALVRTVVNDDPRTAQVDEISVSNATANTTYKLEIEHDGITAEVEYTTGGSPSADDLVNGLAQAINDTALVSGEVLAEADTSGDNVTLTERVADGSGFTTTITQDSPSDLTLSTTTPADQADPIPFGRVMAKDGEFDGGLLGKLPDAADYTSRELQVTLGGSNDGDYRLVVEYHGGQTFVATYTASADGEDTILQNLRDDLNNNGPGVLQASVDTSPSPSELYINPETAGFADFRITETDGPSPVDYTVPTEGDDFRDEFRGVSFKSDTMEKTAAGGDTQYGGNQEVNSLEDDGSVQLRTENGSPSVGDDVFVRLSDNGSLDQHGKVRSDFNSGAIPLPALEITRVVDGDLVEVEVRK